MCRVFQPSCRVCLAENINPPYIYLLEDEFVSETIGNALHLQTRLFDASLYPNHICENCKNIIEPFIRLQDLALSHEKFLLRYQEKIKQFGIKAVEAEVEDQEETHPANYDLKGSLVSERSQTISNKCITEQQEFTMNENIQESYEDQNDNDNSIYMKDEEVHCHICGPSRILKKSSLPNHLKTFHKERDIDCEISGCDKKFKKQSDIHKGERSHCNQCGDYFKDLHYHIKVFHEHVSFPCEMCKKKYTTKQGLNFHIKHTHGNSKKEVCDYCAVEVKHVKHHIKMMHSGIVEKKISCENETCTKKFRTKQEANIHFNAAHLNKKEMCPLCGGWYKNLYTHIHQTHQIEKKHVCDQCGKAFGKKNDLKVHKDRIHLLKRYICPKCGKTISKIREHLKTVHNVANVNMAEIEIVKYDSTVQLSMDKSFDQQIKTYNICSEAGTTMPVPLDSKDGVTLAMVSHHQGWSL